MPGELWLLLDSEGRKTTAKQMERGFLPELYSPRSRSAVTRGVRSAVRSWTLVGLSLPGARQTPARQRAAKQRAAFQGGWAGSPGAGVGGIFQSGFN